MVNLETTRGPAKEQAPTTNSSTPDTQTDEAETGALTPGYLSEGYFKGDEKARYMDPNLVGETAQRLAQDLARGELKQSAFNSILRELKRADKKTLPLEAKRGALSGAIVTAKRLEQRKRASGLLVDVLERNRAAVQTDVDYAAAVKHLTAMGVFLGDYQQQATEGAKK